ncbi:MAG TPA: thiamine pyrophosphate-binding protein, partial [Acetobacteraceae bacterium]|nr:thiamine pyrophosphate-binding protein [Acetobacteraceae bacterium]
IRGPDIDLAGMARAQGCVGIGPVHDRAGLDAALAQAVEAAASGQPVVVDARVEPGYGTEITAALTRGAPGSG